MRHLEKQKANFRVHVGGRRYVRFATLESASRFCNEVFDRTKIVLAIEQIKSDQGSIMGYQAFSGALLALGVFSLSHGAFALAVQLFSGWR